MRGWQCPGCDRCFSPVVGMCPFCGPAQEAETTTVPDALTCPGCGGSRLNAPLTGCPPGSHYTTTTGHLTGGTTES